MAKPKKIWLEKLTTGRKIVPVLLTIGALILFAYYLVENVEKYRSLFDFSFLYLGGAILFVLIGMFAGGLINFLLYRALGARVGLNEAVGLAAVNTLANLLTFAVGMMTKGVYLKRQHQLAYNQYFSATLALYLILIPAAGIVGFVILTGRWLLDSTPASQLLLVMFGFMAFSVVALWIPINKIPLPQTWKLQVLQMIEGWQILGQRKRLVLVITLVYLGMMISIGARYWIAFKVLSQEITFANCILFAAASILTQLISITPGGLVIREGIVAAVAAMHGIPPDISIVAVGLDRMISTTVAAGAGTVYTYYLGRKTVEEVITSSPKLIQVDQK